LEEDGAEAAAEAGVVAAGAAVAEVDLVVLVASAAAEGSVAVVPVVIGDQRSVTWRR
jgi:L-lactate utilization protein LutC